jgi:hypothetical protein
VALLNFKSITIVSIIRIRALQIISFTDPTFTLPMALLWSTLEPCLCIINANLPMVRTILAVISPTIFGSTESNFLRAPEARGERKGELAPFELIAVGGDIEMGRNGAMVGTMQSSIIGGRSTKADSESKKGLGLLLGRVLTLKGKIIHSPGVG